MQTTKQILFIALILANLFISARAQNHLEQRQVVQQKFDDLLLLKSDDYKQIPQTKILFNQVLIKQFTKAFNHANNFEYHQTSQLAYYDFKVHAESDISLEKRAQHKDNKQLSMLFSQTLPILAYAYHTPAPEGEHNPYYQSNEVLSLYLKGLNYTYQRGLTEEAWLIDHNGHGSAKALKAGFTRKAGDFSSQSLNFGGFIQSIFMMRHQLKAQGLFDKYFKVVRNLNHNHGEMYQTFFAQARKSSGIRYNFEVAPEKQYYLNADGIRLFVDYFVPYFLMIEQSNEREQMLQILGKVLQTNIAIKPGSQDTIKPDGTGFHHHNAYVAGYSPYAFEVKAQAIYLLASLAQLDQQNVDILKFALERFRIMANKYTVSHSLRGRLLNGSSVGAAIAINKAIAMLAHPNGANDLSMQQRFSEYFDEDYFFSDQNIGSFYQGKRGVPIRGLGIFRLINEVSQLNTPAAATPQGAFAMPYASSLFFRKDNWLVTAKGFSQYFWDYEGPLNKHQNSFGQNWSNGLLEVMASGNPISAEASGYDLSQGWDWYHVPGTTASHYPIEKRTKKEVAKLRRKQGIKRKEIHRNYNSKTFVGSVSIGEHGMFVQDLEAMPFTSKTDLTARKTYFFVGDKVLAMGSHINGGTEQDETHTTLFQTKLDSNRATQINGKAYVGNNSKITLPGSNVAMTDSVGNSYWLASSSADVTIERTHQHSMSQNYKANSADFTSAYLNHGIKPKQHDYQYVIIPNDKSGTKLAQLAKQPNLFYKVIDNGPIHSVHFPQYQLTATAFYELKESHASLIVKSSSHQAAVLTQQQQDKLTLAVSVPDIGWQRDPKLDFVGLKYASKHFATQVAKKHPLKLVLRGQWKLDGSSDKVKLSKLNSNEMVLEVECQDGLTEKIALISL